MCSCVLRLQLPAVWKNIRSYYTQQWDKHDMTTKFCAVCDAGDSSAPFKVLDVDMDKDPVQTAEDLFANIFEVAEK